MDYDYDFDVNGVNTINNLNNQNKKPKKSKKGIIIAVTILAVIAIIGAVLAITLGLGTKGRKSTKQLDLGQKYLAEMNYEEAIAAFEQALEIDPMNVEAYLGIADAYIGMSGYLTGEGYYSDAIKALEKAKELVNDGVDVFTEYADNHSGKKADAALDDADRLNDKIEEIDSEIKKVEESKKAAEEAKKEAERVEAERKAEEERQAQLPYIEIQPFLNAVSNVWGRNWDQWTVEDFKSVFNIQHVYYDGEYNEESEHPQYKLIKTDWGYKMCESAYFDEYHPKPLELEETESDIAGYQLKSIIIDNNETINYQYGEVITPLYGLVIGGGFYDFAQANGITSVNRMVAYLGLTGMGFVDGTTIEVLTDYGLADVTLYAADGNSGRSIEICPEDYETNPVYGYISVAEYSDSVEMSIGKHK